MKHIFVLAFTLCLAIGTRAQDFVYDRPIKNVKATVKILGGQHVAVLVPDSTPNQRYISIQLPVEYKKEGLKVTYTGIIGKIPPNVRMMGIPLKITAICVTKSQLNKFKLKKGKYVFS